MDARNVARWNGHLKIKAVRDAHAATPVSGLVQRVFARHDALMATIEALMTSPAGRSEGATLKKSAEELAAIAAALPLANALHLLLLEDSTDPQASEKAYALRLTKTAYRGLPAALALAETRSVAQQALARKAQLAAEAGLGPADLKALDEANARFGQLLAAPKVAIEAGKTKNTALSAAFKAASAFVKTELRRAAETFKSKEPKFYATLLEAMRIDDAAAAPAAAAGGGGTAPA